MSFVAIMVQCVHYEIYVLARGGGYLLFYYLEHFDFDFDFDLSSFLQKFYKPLIEIFSFFFFFGRVRTLRCHITSMIFF